MRNTCQVVLNGSAISVTLTALPGYTNSLKHTCVVHFKPMKCSKTNLSILLSLADVPGDIKAVTKQKVPALGLRDLEPLIQHTSNMFNLSGCMVHHKHLQGAPLNFLQKGLGI